MDRSHRHLTARPTDFWLARDAILVIATDAQWASIRRNRRMVRRLALILTAICTLMNFGALARLIVAILAGHAGGGKTLLLDAANIWATNVVVFALWFWSLDRGGPAARGLISENKSDFLFTQQQAGVIDRDLSKIGRPDLSITCFLPLQTQPPFLRPILSRLRREQSC
jgi:hypothetical protein